MKSTFLLLVFTLSFSLSYCQTLKVKDLISFVQNDNSSNFSEIIIKKGFTFSKTFGHPKVDLYLSKTKYEVGSNSGSLKPNRVTHNENNGFLELGFMTVDKVLYETLLKELKSEKLQFVAEGPKKHSFRNGLLTQYTSEKLPEISIEVLDVIVHQFDNDQPKEHWRRYEFRLTNSNY